MPTIKINLPDTLTVDIRGADAIETPVADIPADIVARCVEYGWQQKNADAAASAASVAASDAGVNVDDRAEFKAWRDSDAGKAAITKTRADMIRDSIAARLRGDWTTRQAARAKDSLDDYRVAVVLDMLRAQPNSDAAKAYAAIPSDDQPARRAFRLDIAAKNAALVDPIAERRKATDEADAAELADTGLAM